MTNAQQVLCDASSVKAPLHAVQDVPELLTVQLEQDWSPAQVTQTADHISYSIYDWSRRKLKMNNCGKA